MRSRLYEGFVWHERHAPQYRLKHSVFYLDLDLDEVDRVAKKLPLFSHNRFNLLSLFDRDYEVLAAANDHTEVAREPGYERSLLTIPRTLGYAFNPVSFVLSRDVGGAIRHVAAEVHNTWGERHVYDLPPNGEDQAYSSRATKAFYVSPFLESKGEYELELEEGDDGRLEISITQSSVGGSAFAAGMTLVPRELSTANLLRALIRYPFLNLKVIGAIHWHAIRIWLRGARFHPHPKPASKASEASK